MLSPSTRKAIKQFGQASDKLSPINWDEVLTFLANRFSDLNQRLFEFMFEHQEWAFDVTIPYPKFCRIELKFWLKTESRRKRGERFQPLRCAFIKDEEKNVVAEFIAKTVESLGRLKVRIDYSESDDSILLYRITPENLDEFRDNR